MLVNTREFSPVIFHGMTDAPPDSYEYEEWWNEEYKRCIEGYSVGGVKITGYHYFYLNWWKIKGINQLVYPDQKMKRLVPPRFLQLDYDFFHEWDRCKKENKNLCIAKKRQCGFSEKVSSICGYEFSFIPASQTLIIAGEEKYSKNTMGFVKRGLNELYGSEFYKHRTPDSLAETKAQVLVYDEHGNSKWEGYMSELFMLTSKNNPECGSRFSPSLVIYEETGHFENLIETNGYIQPSLESDGGMKTGWFIALGTGGEMGKGSRDAATMFFNPDDFNCMDYENVYTDDPDKKRISYFVPGWRYYITDAQGIDDVEAGKAKMKANRDKALNSSDQDALIKEAIARPENPDEIYTITGKNRFPIMKLNAQRSRIFRSKTLSNLTTMAKLEWVYDMIPRSGKPKGNIVGIEYKPDPKGEYLIIDPPQKGKDGKPLKVYYGGTDSYDKDDAPTSNSTLSCSIFDGMRDMFVARVTCRPEDSDTAYEMSAKLCYFYNCRNLIEYSNILIFKWYARNGFEWMLKERPSIAYANVMRSQVVNKYGIDPSTRDSWLTLYKDYMQATNCEKMYDLVQVTKAIEWKEKEIDPDYNCDITIGSSLAYLHYMDEIEFQENTVDQKEVRREFFAFKTKNGQISQTHYAN